MNDPFEPRDGELWYVELYDKNTYETITRNGPMPKHIADGYELAISHPSDVSYGTRQVQA